VREIRTLRAMWRELETISRFGLRHSQRKRGAMERPDLRYLRSQSSTLPRIVVPEKIRGARYWCQLT